MLGLGFLNSIFLFALAAMALPIVIHLLNRRRVRKIKFSSLEFLVELSRRRMSKINLRRWIILLLRTLAVLFIVLSFARPTLQSNAALILPGEAPTYVVVCIDMSASMQVERETGTAFTAAQELARRVIDEAGSNDVMNVIGFSSHTEVMFETGTHNKQIVKNAIASLKATGEPASEAAAIDVAIALIEKSGLDAGVVYVISDFRAVGDSVIVFDAPDRVRVNLLPVYTEPVDNVSIDRVFTPRKLIRPGEVVRVSVALTNHSMEHPANFPLELIVEGRRKAEQLVRLSPAASATITFGVSMNEWGIHHCRVAKNHDRLPIDDDRYFLLEVSRKIPVTLIRGRKFTGEDNRNVASYFFVDKALNPRGSGDGEFSVDTIDEQALTVARLNTKGVVVWTDPTNLGREQWELLMRYIHAGGAALVFVGGDRGPMWRSKDFRAYLGIQKITNRESGDGEHMTSFQKEHPVFNLFNDDELELLSRSSVRRFVSASGVAPDSVLAYFSSGDPAMWECRRGKGRLLVVAMSPDMPSGDLPLSPMFLPLIHTSVSYLASAEGPDFRRENFVGSALFFDLPSTWASRGTQLVVSGPNGEKARPAMYEAPAGGLKVMLTRPEAAGFYRLLSDTTRITDVAVNVNTVESNLNPRPLTERFIGDARIIGTSDHFVENLRRERQGREVYAAFLLLAVCALVGEAVLGRKA